MEKCAIIIGINNTPGMSYLSSPCDYARKMDQWAKVQGFETRLFVDVLEDGSKVPIKIGDIRISGSELLNSNPRQLLIYFAGHGMELEPGNDIWLLPGYKDWASEAINITKNKEILFRSGIDHIIFISDACRTPRDGNEDKFVIGSEIFPSVDRTNYNVVIDVLNSTWPGETSIDYRDNHKYISLYSECILSCLNGTVPEVIRHIHSEDDDRAFPAVISRDLSRYLKQEVPRIIKEKTGKNQQPNSNINSDEPIYISRFKDEDLVLDNNILPEGPPNTDRGSRSHPTVAEKLVFIQSLPIESPSNIKIKEAVELIKSIHEEMASENRLPEDRTGVIIHGNDDPGIFNLTHPGDIPFNFYPIPPYKIFKKVDVINFIKVHDFENSLTLLMSNPEQTAFYPITILPNFITNVIFHQGTLINVDYYPTHGYRRWDAIHQRAEVAERKANIVAAAANGIFQGTEELGSYLRSYKSLDPTLGLFAVYAYYQNGKFKKVNSVFNYMSREEEPVLPEIMLLNQLSLREPTKQIYSQQPIIPMLTQGWSYLDTQSNEITSTLQNFLRPGLWTSFSKASIDAIGYLLEKIR